MTCVMTETPEAPTHTHLCLADKQCRASTPTDQINPKTQLPQRQPATTEKPNTLCRRCTSDVRRAIDELPHDYQQLHSAIGDLTHGSTGIKVTASTDPPIPFNSRIDALMGDIADQLQIAADRVATALNCDSPTTERMRGRTRKAEIKACATMIASNLPKLLDSPEQDEYIWTGNGESRLQPTHDGRYTYQPTTRAIPRTGIQTALKLAELHREARKMLGGPTKPRTRLMFGCIECGAPYLYQDGPKVECDECGHDWTSDAFGLLHKEIERQEMEELKQQIEDLNAVLYQAWLNAEQIHWLAAEREHHLTRIAHFAGHDTPDQLLAVIDGSDAA